jgi:Xaa-Pro aminopeptidase
MSAEWATLPFDHTRLDRRMDEDGIDLVLATSKHNTRYLLGGYGSLFFAQMEAVGLSRHLPIVGYPRGQPALAFYVGNPGETSQQALQPLWVTTIRNEAWTSAQAATLAAQVIRESGLAASAPTIAVEWPFLPSDAYLALQRLLPEARFVDAVPVLEDLRAVKRPAELALLKEASECVVAAMLAVLQQAGPGVTTQQIADRLLQEEVARGLAFDYCLAAAGPTRQRTPSASRWERGASLSLDSGGNKAGYIGDLARMAVLGRPSGAQEALLAEIDTVQMAAREPIKAGALGSAIYEHAHAAQARCAHGREMEFVAHGMGLVSHEAPRLARTGLPYPGDHAEKPLEAGMVLSIETTLVSLEHGYIKLEDTVAVTETGWEAYGDAARGWNTVDA